MTPAIFARALPAGPSIRPRPTARAPLFAPALAALLVATLTTASGVSHAAGKLYRWSEPDGSLTFSPTAPSDGTPYETVDPMTMKPIDAARAGERPAPSIVRAEATRAAPRTTPPMGAAVDASPSPTTRTNVALPSRPTTDGASTASREKDRRCSELEKRVISLERRLASPLTPEAMDDTVVQMARYQQNVDRHCR